MSMGHISCTRSGDLEKEKSKSSHRIHRIEVVFSKGTKCECLQNDLQRLQWVRGCPSRSDFLCCKY